MENKKVLEIKNLKKYYGKHRGVENLNLEINKGEIFGFIGPNGAGKSTTIRCILSLIYPTSGSIEVFGMDSIKDRVSIAKRVGYLPSEVFYYDNTSCLQFLKYSASFYENSDVSDIKKYAEYFELDLNKKVQDLSLGNRKKVGIISALLNKPEFLILDEPSNGLDPLIQKKLFKLLLELKDMGTTILLSSHNLMEIKKYCERCAIIKDGKLIEISTVENLNRTNYKTVKISADEMDLENIDKINGVEIKDKESGHRVYLYKNDINELITAFSKINIKNLTLEDPDLEDIFLHYYE